MPFFIFSMTSPTPQRRSLIERIRRFINLRHEVVDLHHEVHALRAQRDLLEKERNELKTFVDGWETLEAERDGLKDYAAQLEMVVAKAHLAHRFPLGHFYSPVTDPHDDLVKQAAEAFSRRSEMATPEFIDSDAMLDLFRKLSGHAARLHFPERRTAPKRYFRRNESFGAGDALILASLMLEYRPKRIVEIGSGMSSLVMMDVNDEFFDGGVALDFIEPYPKVLLNALPPDDPYLPRLQQKRSQDVPLELFASLEAGDMLFIDSSHVMKTASDVEDQWRRIIPALKPGVLIHIHDMFDGFEYPPEWIVEDNRSWNEIYLVRNVLTYSQQFRVLFFNDFFYFRHWGLTGELMPQAQENSGSSLWIEKVA